MCYLLPGVRWSPPEWTALRKAIELIRTREIQLQKRELVLEMPPVYLILGPGSDRSICPDKRTTLH